MLGNFLIGLREGLEAALVVSILVAFLVRTDRRSVLPKVWLGVGIAVAVSVGVTAALALTQQALTFEAQEAFGGALSIIAVGFVTWMIFWMRRTARTSRASCAGARRTRSDLGATAVVLMAALAVGREGLETALFFFTAAQAAGETTQPLIGFLLGIAVAVVLAYLIYRGAVKHQPRPLLLGHRRAADLRGRRDPRLRRARPAGGRDPARPQHARLRREHRRPAGLLVRRAAQGRLQLLPADHGARRPSCGCSTSASC